MYTSDVVIPLSRGVSVVLAKISEHMCYISFSRAEDTTLHTITVSVGSKFIFISKSFMELR